MKTTLLVILGILLATFAVAGGIPTIDRKEMQSRMNADEPFIGFIETEKGNYAVVDTNPALDDKELDYISGTPFTLEIHLYDDHLALRDQYKEMGGLVPNWSGKGFSRVITTNLKQPFVCELHVVKPFPVVAEPELLVWGHELRHCIEGQYHEQPSAMRRPLK